MDANFPKRLSALRRERRLSQRTAAAALNISQALLSHYENGMREPGLDFIRTACGYYGVSADYLLGISPVRSAVYSSAGVIRPGTVNTLTSAAAELFRGLDACGSNEAAEAMCSMLTVFLYGVMSRYDASVSADTSPEVCSALIQLYRARIVQVLRARDEDGGSPLEYSIPAALKQAAQAELDIFDDYWR